MPSPVKLELLTLGEAFEDLIFLGLERLPAAGEEVRTSDFVRTVGGGAVITAVAAARLGTACGIWSALGAPAVTRLRAERVTIRNLKRSDEAHAISAALSTRDNRTFVTFNGVNDVLEDRLLAAAPAIHARHVHFAFSPRDCRKWIPELKRLRSRTITTSWDFGWNEKLLDDESFVPLLAELDVLFINEQEARLYSRRRTLNAALAVWRRSERAVIVKLGADGSRWLSRTDDLHVPAPRTRVIDTTGAGDAFNGGFLTARLRGHGPAAALRLGNRIGALSTRAAGGVDALPFATALPANLLQRRPQEAVSMKLAIIGAGGARTPLLVNGLIRSDLPIQEIALFDPDEARLQTMAALARTRAGSVTLTPCSSSTEAITEADFVFISIRVGGIAARAHDETTALAHGIVGQETVGPGGFAKAMRTVPHVVAYARQVQALAPDAWIINFTNPVGIVTQAVRTATQARIIGICDTPTELYEEVCHALDVPSSESYVDYFGLNHLGWIREVYHQGEPQLHRLWTEPERLARIYRSPLFALEFLRQLRLLPTEYVYYYYRSADAYANVLRTGTSRARVIEGLNRQLFTDLAAAAQDPVAVYERYINARDAGYMQLESGNTGPRQLSPWGELTGYDKIALNTVRALHFKSNAVIPLNVENRGNLPDLADDDVIEVPCVVNGNGALPLHSGAVPDAVRSLLVQVKEYERLTVDAALTRDPEGAIHALARNPLVPDQATARQLVSALVLDAG